jgi:hypothetical protein
MAPKYVATAHGGFPSVPADRKHGRSLNKVYDEIHATPPPAGGRVTVWVDEGNDRWERFEDIDF